ncbi:type IV pilus modification PilV family protein [Massilia yuzhufengensis]|uniref:MSHA pilin protein MshD n=1 Tax=Massilia yuzhufengensis TaxID=1164594 RepID=A0A1I1LJD6_9BURK|nr:prepilin-type N-terminal cleavage/methylation domain-containing protein [Massilia yuzhufengensis]SFC72682.1 MSHA pilin protein MshD [Massilia yuzhufengensis]
MYSRRMAGVTLVELVIAIVILAAALGGLVAAFAQANRASADPVVTRQMLAIADSMMEEVLLKPFAVDNDPSPTRADFNDVRDFDTTDDTTAGYTSNGIVDIDGVAIEGLAGYSVSVQVNNVALDGAPAADALRVIVTVTSGPQQLSLTGWRTQPW